MIQIDTIKITDITILDARLRADIGGHIIGLSGSGNGTIVHLTDDATAQEQADATTALAEVDTLTIVADKTTVTADGIDEAVITCGVLGNDFDYVVYLNGVLSISGTVADGTLELSVWSAGDYIVELRNQSNYETGKIVITGV